MDHVLLFNPTTLIGLSGFNPAPDPTRNSPQVLPVPVPHTPQKHRVAVNGLAGELGSIMVWEAEAIDWSRQKIAEVTGCPPPGQLLLVNNEEVGYAGSWSLGSAVTLIKHQPDVAAAISLLLRTFRYDVPTVYSQLGDELRHSVSICLVAVECTLSSCWHRLQPLLPPEFLADLSFRKAAVRRQMAWRRILFPRKRLLKKQPPPYAYQLPR